MLVELVQMELLAEAAEVAAAQVLLELMLQVQV
jgi:hypothetical protein